MSTSTVHTITFEGRNPTTCAILSFLQNSFQIGEIKHPGAAEETIETLAEMFYELTCDDGFKRKLTIELTQEPK